MKCKPLTKMHLTLCRFRRKGTTTGCLEFQSGEFKLNKLNFDTHQKSEILFERKTLVDDLQTYGTFGVKHKAQGPKSASNNSNLSH